MNKIITVVLALLMFSCNSTGKTKTKTNTGYVKMERTLCYGTCPNYVIEIYSTGLVRYTGRKFAEPTGVFEKNIGTAKTSKLLKQFDKYRVDTCKASYDNMIQDVPGIIYTFKYRGKEKTIYNAHFGPSFLKMLADETDKLSTPKEKGWKKKADYKEE